MPLVDGQKLLVDLATKIVESAGVIEEILAVARGIKAETDLAALSLSGARLLQLLEPFLASLVPAEVRHSLMIFQNTSNTTLSVYTNSPCFHCIKQYALVF